MGRVVIGTALVAAAALAAASCGGGGGGSAVSKEDFISQADALCKHYDDQFSSETLPTFPKGDPTSASTSNDDVKAFADPFSATKDLRAEQFHKLRKLQAPEDFQDQWDRVLSDLDTSLHALGEMADAAAQADREAVSAAVNKGRFAAAKADQIARDYGFKVCGHN